MNKYFTILEVAEILNCNHYSVRRLIESGKLKAHRVDNGRNENGRKTLRISQEQLDEFLNNSLVKPN